MKKTTIKSKTLNSIMITATVVLTVLLIVLSVLSSDAYSKLNETIDRKDFLQQSATELQSGSDYLTEQVRLFAVTGEKKYFNNFFNEVNVTRRRDKAIESLSEENEPSKVREYLQNALIYSNQLLETEKYAMALVIDAKGETIEDDYVPLAGTVLTDEDKALSDEAKKEKAIDLVFNEHYQLQKGRIYNNVNAAMDAVMDTVNGSKTRLSNKYHTLLVLHNIMIFTVMTMIISFIVIFTRYFVNPLLDFINRMSEEQTVSVAGSDELMTMARTYNDMLQKIHSDQQELSYEASHDSLTGLYNRKVFEDARNTLDNFTMLLIDIDYFKSINDTYGHEIGDKVLIKMGRILKKSFRSEDYVCRIGGDEFAVIMVNVTSNLKYLIETKIKNMAAAMADTSDGLPFNSLSIGVAFADRENPSEDIYVDCDKALYAAKEAGRNSHRYY